VSYSLGGRGTIGEGKGGEGEGKRRVKGFLSFFFPFIMLLKRSSFLSSSLTVDLVLYCYLTKV